MLKSMLAKVDRQAWRRFFIAITGLTLAFAAALYSTVARDAGSVVMTAILASFALLTAGLVGILTVPYLAKRVAAHRFRDRFQYEFTKEFAVYLIAVLVIVVAALNTGNNLLFIVVSAMLAAIAISGFASAGMLRALELDASLPAHVFAGNTVMARLTLTNRRWWAPAFSVSIVPLKSTAGKTRYRWQRTIFAWPRKRPPRQQWLRLTDWEWKAVTEPLGPPAVFQGSVYFPMVRRKSTASADIELKFERRGLYAQKGLGIATRFPFAFFKKTRPVAFTQEVVAATIKTEPIGPQRFRATVTLSDSSLHMFDLAGDAVYVDAHVLKWRPIGTLLGLPTAYELDRIRCSRRVNSSHGPCLLRERCCIRCRRSLRDYHVLASHCRQKPANQQGSGTCIPPRGRDADHVQSGIMECDRQGKRVINVIADVGVYDDGL